MKINKEKVKKAFKITFYIIGSICTVIVLGSLLIVLIPSWKEDAYYGYGSDDELSSLNYEYDYLYKDSYAAEEYPESEEGTERSEYSDMEIKTGEVSLSVDNINSAKDSIDNIKEKYSGDITYSYEGGEGVDRYVYLTLKIESSDFEQVFEEIADIDGEVTYSSTNATDVTEEYTDLRSRLTNLEAVETQLLEILDQSEDVEDILAVYTELASTRNDIEVLEGQIKYLENQTDYSYITVYLTVSSIGGEITEETWKPLGVFKDALRSLVSFLETLGNIFIWIIVFSPIGAIVFGIYWLIRKKRRKNKK